MVRGLSLIGNVILLVLCIVFLTDVAHSRALIKNLEKEKSELQGQIQLVSWQNGMFFEQNNALRDKVSAKETELVGKTQLLETALQSAADYRVAHSNDRADLIQTRNDLRQVRGDLLFAQRRMTDFERKLNGEYQRLAQGILNRLVSQGLGAVEWDEEMDVFEIDYLERSPTVYSTRWAMLRYDGTMFWLNRDARETGHYYYYGNLGDVTLPMLEHIVVGYKKGIIPRGEAELRISLMERYVRPDDQKSLSWVRELREELSS